MRTVTIALLAWASVASAQVWEKVQKPPTPPVVQTQPQQPSAPQTLPPSIPKATAFASGKLPREENLAVIDLRSLRVQYLAQRLVVTQNNQVFREFNPLSGDAEATADLLRNLLAVRWGTIGKSRVVVEYGLTAGASGELMVPLNAGFPVTALPIDLKTVRVEPIRGAWCVRDNAAVLLNFGQEQQEAEQAVAVCQKYGFNRLGTVGKGATPAITYFFAASEGTQGAMPSLPAEVARTRPNAALDRSGIDVPGLGFVGEKIAIEVKKLEVRRERTDVTLRHGSDVLAHFGADEWAARDAVRVIQDGHFTEFCRFGHATFFLVNGKPPKQVPFLARSNRFDPGSLRAKELSGKWYVTDITGKPILHADNEKEANDLVRLLKAYEFDTVATVGNSTTANLQFLARSR